ncbi:hypothetical protein LEP1GSC192_0741 [Leptospira sp. B5-022]|nr:hypothetical protein LEP1GSC192_0741 [Leptospira sp. B5-022]
MTVLFLFSNTERTIHWIFCLRSVKLIRFNDFEVVLSEK